MKAFVLPRMVSAWDRFGCWVGKAPIYVTVLLSAAFGVLVSVAIALGFQ